VLGLGVTFSFIVILGIPTSVGVHMNNDALNERLHAERLAMDMRLQLAGMFSNFYTLCTFMCVR